tara:strand:- start:25 stop:291 length:267 start_codon:yes stop_codon:yes gene_type:complete
MNKYSIKCPIWKTKSIGIAENRLEQDDLIVDIEYKTSDGKKLYPNTYLINKNFAKQYPRQNVKGINLIIIPIKDLDEYTIIKKEKKDG